MQTVAPRLRAAVHEQARNRIQLIAEVEPDRSDRRLVTQSGTDRVLQVVKVDAPRPGPHVPGIEKEHAAEVAVQDRPQLLAEPEHAVAADRLTRDERADLVPSPSADTGGAAQEILLSERH